jgi:hypothetical protein
MTPTNALTLYHVPHIEQEPVRDMDLVNLATAFPAIEPVLMELQYRRNQMERMEVEIDVLRNQMERMEVEIDVLRDEVALMCRD